MKFTSSLRISRLSEIRAIFKDEDWAELYLDGSERGFNLIYERFRKPVLRYASSKISDPEASEEIAQEVFIKLHRFRNSFARGRSFESWFWTVVRNTTHDWLRKGMNAPILEGDGAQSAEGGPSLLETVACPRLNAEGRLLRKSFRRGLLKRMRSLTRLQRKVIWLRVVHDLPLQDIAERLGLSLASVKCLIYRARACLQVDPGVDFSLA